MTKRFKIRSTRVDYKSLTPIQFSRQHSIHRSCRIIDRRKDHFPLIYECINASMPDNTQIKESRNIAKYHTPIHLTLIVMQMNGNKRHDSPPSNLSPKLISRKCPLHFTTLIISQLPKDPMESTKNEKSRLTMLRVPRSMSTAAKLPNPHTPIAMAQWLGNSNLTRISIVVALITERVIALHLFDIHVIPAQFPTG